MHYIISGPCGVGKSLIVKKMAEVDGFFTPIPYTTRKKRKDEQNGVEYHFIKESQLYEMTTGMKDGYWRRQLGGNVYGYSRESIIEFFEYENSIMHMQSDLAFMVKRDYHDVVLIFLDFENYESMSNKIEELVGNDLECKMRIKYSEDEKKNAYKFDLYMKSNDPYVLLRKIENISTRKQLYTSRSGVSDKQIYKISRNSILIYESQRMENFRGFLVFLLIIALIVALCVSNELFFVGACVSILTLLITFVFYQIDFEKRCQIEHLQQIIKFVEDKMDSSFNDDYLQKIKFISRNDKLYHRIIFFEVLFVDIFIILVGMLIYFINYLL